MSELEQEWWLAESYRNYKKEIERHEAEIARLREALEMVRDADNDCHADGLPTIPAVARAKIDRALAAAATEADKGPKMGNVIERIAAELVGGTVFPLWDDAMQKEAADEIRRALRAVSDTHRLVPFVPTREMMAEKCDPDDWQLWLEHVAPDYTTEADKAGGD